MAQLFAQLIGRRSDLVGTDGMSKRQRKKLDAARRVNESGSEILAYGTGSGHARLSKGLIGLVVGFAVLFLVVLVLVHVVLIPGVVFVVVVIGLIRPKRGVALTPDAVLVFHESVWNGKPNRLILSSPASSFSASNPPISGGSRVSLLLGTERVTLKASEYERLLRAVAPPAVELPPT
jgi:4-amino-4-deoxy-L-arabinose transferase-like glycosyltransferase